MTVQIDAELLTPVNQKPQRVWGVNGTAHTEHHEKSRVLTQHILSIRPTTGIILPSGHMTAFGYLSGADERCHPFTNVS